MTGPMVESEKDRMVRQGLVTPFGALPGFERRAMGGAVVTSFSRRPIDDLLARPVRAALFAVL